ncbi:MAG: SAM-dependent methyltransferase [Flavobacteriales bacterium]|jgi:SAM-dependent methyltransferase
MAIDTNRLYTDFGNAAQDYATHRAGFPENFFDELVLRRYVSPGQQVLDLGTGTGTLAIGLAERGLYVVGLDRSADMIAQAQQIPTPSDRVTWTVARAEETGLADNSVDVVIAGQCWHWFDPERAAAEVKRVLRPGGTLIIARFDWVNRPAQVVEASLGLVDAWCPRTRNPWYSVPDALQYPTVLASLIRAGFGPTHDAFSLWVDVHYTHEAWRGRMRASAPIGGTLDAAGVAGYDRALSDLLATVYADDPVLSVPHRAFACVVRSASV